MYSKPDDPKGTAYSVWYNTGPAATIREIVDIPIIRPRNKKAIAHDPVYMDTHDRLLGLLFEKLSIED